MSNSILISTKKHLGLSDDYKEFDQDIITHVNSALATLSQLGVGPVGGYMIEDADAVWRDFLQDNLDLNPVKSYVYLRVRLLFDPPATPHAINSMQEQVKEMEWRLNVAGDRTAVPIELI